MSSKSNGTSFLSKSKVEGQVVTLVSSRLSRCVCNLLIKKMRKIERVSFR